MADAWPPLVSRDLSAAGREITMEEWLALGEDEPGEMVAGRLMEEEVPDAVHELAVSWLVQVLRQWLGNVGFIFGSELKLLVAQRTGRKADVVVFLPDSQPPRRRGPVTTPPDVVIEVVTPSPRDERRDRVDKMADYARFGVRSYWLVDPALGTFEVFERNESGHYQKAIGATGGVVDGIPGCAGLSIDLDALWSELERLPE